MAGEIQRPRDQDARRHFIGKARQRTQRRFDTGRGLYPHAELPRGIRQPIRRHRAFAIRYLHRDDVARQPCEVVEKRAGMMGNKDAGAFLANFAGLTRHIIAVQIPDREGAMPPDRLADAARALGMRVETSASVEAALRSLARLAYEVPPRILITGSLYLAGHVLSLNGTPPG